MRAPIISRRDVLEVASKCFLDQHERDFFPDFLSTLIAPPVPAGITPDLALQVWEFLIEELDGDTMISRQMSIADAFINSSSINETAIRWRALLAGEPVAA